MTAGRVSQDVMVSVTSTPVIFTIASFQSPLSHAAPWSSNLQRYFYLYRKRFFHLYLHHSTPLLQPFILGPHTLFLPHADLHFSQLASFPTQPNPKSQYLSHSLLVPPIALLHCPFLLLPGKYF